MRNEEDDYDFDEENEFTEPTTDNFGRPSMGSQDWQSYVMEHFQSHELYEGKYPFVKGLRRVAEEIIGPVIGGLARTVQCPSQSNGYIATVEYEIVIWDKCQSTQKQFNSTADASPQNCKYPFSLHLSAMAETRAEARALRKLLCISVASAEEVSIPEPDPINDTQRKMLNNKAKRADVNIERLVEFLGMNVNKLSHEDGIKLNQEVEKYQREEFPEELKGYKEWY